MAGLCHAVLLWTLRDAIEARNSDQIIGGLVVKDAEKSRGQVMVEVLFPFGQESQ